MRLYKVTVGDTTVDVYAEDDKRAYDIALCTYPGQMVKNVVRGAVSKQATEKIEHKPELL